MLDARLRPLIDPPLNRMGRALDELHLEGVRTTAAFHRALMDNPDFRRGEVHTRYVEEVLWKDR